MNKFLEILPKYESMMSWKREKEEEFKQKFGSSYLITIESLDSMTGIDSICIEVAGTLNVTVSHLIGTSRRTHFKDARHIAIYLCKTYLNASDVELADYFSRDRTTILHSVRAIQNLLEVGDEKICNKMDRCRKAIDSRIKEHQS